MFAFNQLKKSAINSLLLGYQFNPYNHEGYFPLGMLDQKKDEQFNLKSASMSGSLITILWLSAFGNLLTPCP